MAEDIKITPETQDDLKLQAKQQNVSNEGVSEQSSTFQDIMAKSLASLQENTKSINQLKDQIKKTFSGKSHSASSSNQKTNVSVDTTINEETLKKQISKIKDFSVNCDVKGDEKQLEKIKNTIAGIVQQAESGNKKAADFLSSLDIDSLSSLQNAEQVLKQLGTSAKKSGIQLEKLNAVAKTGNNIFEKSSFSVKKFTDNIKANAKDSGYLGATLRAIGTSVGDLAKDFQKSSRVTGTWQKKLSQAINVGGTFAAVDSLTDLAEKFQKTHESVLKYKEDIQTVSAGNSDLLPGGAKKLQQIRSEFNLSREQVVVFAKQLNGLRGTTHGVQALTDAMKGMQDTIGKVDVSNIKSLVDLMQKVPKQQLDALTKGGGSSEDAAAGVLNIVNSGKTQDFLDLGASGSFGKEYAQNMGVNISDNHKGYNKAKAATKNTMQTVGNITSNVVGGAMVLAPLLTQIKGVKQTGIGGALKGAFNTIFPKGKGKEKAGDVSSTGGDSGSYSDYFDQIISLLQKIAGESGDNKEESSQDLDMGNKSDVKIKRNVNGKPQLKLRIPQSTIKKQSVDATSKTLGKNIAKTAATKAKALGGIGKVRGGSVGKMAKVASPLLKNLGLVSKGFGLVSKFLGPVGVGLTVLKAGMDVFNGYMQNKKWGKEASKKFGVKVDGGGVAGLKQGIRDAFGINWLQKKFRSADEIQRRKMKSAMGRDDESLTIGNQMKMVALGMIPVIGPALAAAYAINQTKKKKQANKELDKALQNVQESNKKLQLIEMKNQRIMQNSVKIADANKKMLASINEGQFSIVEATKVAAVQKFNSAQSQQVGLLTSTEYERNTRTMVESSRVAKQKDLKALQTERQKVLASNIDPTIKFKLLNDIMAQQIQIRKKALNNLKDALSLDNIPTVISEKLNKTLNTASADINNMGAWGSGDMTMDAISKNIDSQLNIISAQGGKLAQNVSTVGKEQQKDIEAQQQRKKDMIKNMQKGQRDALMVEFDNASESWGKLESNQQKKPSKQLVEIMSKLSDAKNQLNKGNTQTASTMLSKMRTGLQQELNKNKGQSNQNQINELLQQIASLEGKVDKAGNNVDFKGGDDMAHYALSKQFEKGNANDFFSSKVLKGGKVDQRYNKIFQSDGKGGVRLLGLDGSKQQQEQMKLLLDQNAEDFSLHVRKSSAEKAFGGNKELAEEFSQVSKKRDEAKYNQEQTDAKDTKALKTVVQRYSNANQQLLNVLKKSGKFDPKKIEEIQKKINTNNQSKDIQSRSANNTSIATQIDALMKSKIDDDGTAQLLSVAKAMMADSKPMLASQTILGDNLKTYAEGLKSLQSYINNLNAVIDNNSKVVRLNTEAKMAQFKSEISGWSGDAQGASQQKFTHFSKNMEALAQKVRLAQKSQKDLTDRKQAFAADSGVFYKKFSDNNKDEKDGKEVSQFYASISKNASAFEQIQKKLSSSSITDQQKVEAASKAQKMVNDQYEKQKESLTKKYQQQGVIDANGKTVQGKDSTAYQADLAKLTAARDAVVGRINALGVVEKGLMEAKKTQLSNQKAIIDAQKQYITTMSQTIQTQKMMTAKLKSGLAENEMKLAIEDFKSGGDLKALRDEIVSNINIEIDDQINQLTANLKKNNEAIRNMQAKKARGEKIDESKLQNLKNASISIQKEIKGKQLEKVQRTNNVTNETISATTDKYEIIKQSIDIQKQRAEYMGTPQQVFDLQVQGLQNTIRYIQQIDKLLQDASLTEKQRMVLINKRNQAQLGAQQQMMGAQRNAFEKMFAGMLGGIKSQGAFKGFTQAHTLGSGYMIGEDGIGRKNDNPKNLGGYNFRRFMHQMSGAGVPVQRKVKNFGDVGKRIEQKSNPTGTSTNSGSSTQEKNDSSAQGKNGSRTPSYIPNVNKGDVSGAAKKGLAPAKTPEQQKQVDWEKEENELKTLGDKDIFVKQLVVQKKILQLLQGSGRSVKKKPLSKKIQNNSTNQPNTTTNNRGGTAPTANVDNKGKSSQSATAPTANVDNKGKSSQGGTAPTANVDNKGKATNANIKETPKQITSKTGREHRHGRVRDIMIDNIGKKSSKDLAYDSSNLMDKGRVLEYFDKGNYKKGIQFLNSQEGKGFVDLFDVKKDQQGKIIHAKPKYDAYATYKKSADYSDASRKMDQLEQKHGVKKLKAQAQKSHENIDKKTQLQLLNSQEGKGFVDLFHVKRNKEGKIVKATLNAEALADEGNMARQVQFNRLKKEKIANNQQYQNQQQESDFNIQRGQNAMKVQLLQEQSAYNKKYGIDNTKTQKALQKATFEKNVDDSISFSTIKSAEQLQKINTADASTAKQLKANRDKRIDRLAISYNDTGRDVDEDLQHYNKLRKEAEQRGDKKRIAHIDAEVQVLNRAKKLSEAEEQNRDSNASYSNYETYVNEQVKKVEDNHADDAASVDKKLENIRERKKAARSTTEIAQLTQQENILQTAHDNIVDKSARDYLQFSNESAEELEAKANNTTDYNEKTKYLRASDIRSKENMADRFVREQGHFTNKQYDKMIQNAQKDVDSKTGQQKVEAENRLSALKQAKGISENVNKQAEQFVSKNENMTTLDYDKKIQQLQSDFSTAKTDNDKAKIKRELDVTKQAKKVSLQRYAEKNNFDDLSEEDLKERNEKAISTLSNKNATTAQKRAAVQEMDAIREYQLGKEQNKSHQMMPTLQSTYSDSFNKTNLQFDEQISNIEKQMATLPQNSKERKDLAKKLNAVKRNKNAYSIENAKADKYVEQHSNFSVQDYDVKMKELSSQLLYTEMSKEEKDKKQAELDTVGRARTVYLQKLAKKRGYDKKSNAELGREYTDSLDKQQEYTKNNQRFQDEKRSAENNIDELNQQEQKKDTELKQWQKKRVTAKDDKEKLDADSNIERLKEQKKMIQQQREKETQKIQKLDKNIKDNQTRIAGQKKKQVELQAVVPMQGGSLTTAVDQWANKKQQQAKQEEEKAQADKKAQDAQTGGKTTTPTADKKAQSVAAAQQATKADVPTADNKAQAVADAQQASNKPKLDAAGNPITPPTNQTTTGAENPDTGNIKTLQDVVDSQKEKDFQNLSDKQIFVKQLMVQQKIQQLLSESINQVKAGAEGADKEEQIKRKKHNLQGLGTYANKDELDIQTEDTAFENSKEDPASKQIALLEAILAAILDGFNLTAKEQKQEIQAEISKILADERLPKIKQQIIKQQLITMKFADKKGNILPEAYNNKSYQEVRKMLKLGETSAGKHLMDQAQQLEMEAAGTWTWWGNKEEKQASAKEKRAAAHAMQKKTKQNIDDFTVSALTLANPKALKRELLSYTKTDAQKTREKQREKVDAFRQQKMAQMQIPALLAKTVILQQHLLENVKIISDAYLATDKKANKKLYEDGTIYKITNAATYTAAYDKGQEMAKKSRENNQGGQASNESNVSRSNGSRRTTGTYSRTERSSVNGGNSKNISTDIVVVDENDARIGGGRITINVQQIGERISANNNNASVTTASTGG